MDEQVEAQSTNFMELAAELVAAYVSNNNVPVSELPNVITSVHTALVGLADRAPVEDAGPEKPTPAQIKKSIAPDALTSFIDGKRYKTLKRHLTTHGLTMESYRVRYGLPSDYPSTSASYSAQRSELARSLGLGQQRRKPIQKAASGDETVSEVHQPSEEQSRAVEAAKAAPKARGRKKAEKPAETA